jgi:hypothetical protein
VSGVANEHDTAAVPLLLIYPLDRRAVDLFVTIQGGEKLLNRFGKPVKALPQARQPAAHVITEMRHGNMTKSISAAAAHRAETEEALISEEEAQVRQVGWPHHAQRYGETRWDLHTFQRGLMYGSRRLRASLVLGAQTSLRKLTIPGDSPVSLTDSLSQLNS